MKVGKLKYFFILLLTIVLGCENQDKNNHLAKIDNFILTKNDIANETPMNLSSEDSLVFVNNYIHNWLIDHLIVKKAKELIPSEILNVEKKIEKYKMSLISYEFEQFYINKRLDTNVNTFEIIDYYNNHLDDFVLNDYVVKCLYIKVPKNTKSLRDFKKYFYISSDGMIDKLMPIAQKEASVFYYNPEEWIFFDDLLKQIPALEKYSKIDFIKKKKKVILEIGEEIYFINIYDFLIKDGTSPYSFEKDKIKSILLNQRASDLRKKLRQDLYEDGIKNKLIEKI